jgi:hypothetical protein
MRSGLRRRCGNLREAEMGAADRIGIGNSTVEGERLAPLAARRCDLPVRRVDIAEALDAIGFALKVFNLPEKRQRCSEALARIVIIQEGKRNIAEARNAIGLAQHGANLAVERQRRLVAFARAVVIGARKRNLGP